MQAFYLYKKKQILPYIINLFKMRKIFISVFFISVLSVAYTNDKPAKNLFNQKGKEIKYSKMISELQSADIVFFGESHNDPISHWMQYEITKDLYEIVKNNLIIGAEMFESDNQLILNEYLDSAFGDKKFEADARLWPNYQTDYKPVLKFALENKLRYIATNIPRRYASMIYKKGFEAIIELSDEAKKYISPDLEHLYNSDVECYKSMSNIEGMDEHQTDNLAKSQASKDATMAHFILKNWSKGKLFLHFNGSYHSDNFEGIVWWIKKLNPDLKIITLSTVYQKNIDKLDDENLDKANYIIAVPENMTQTNN
ncbi:MAG: ChaN family lipoprotein [Bacteroidales bacterium]|nr:ChaN family lipoprotein [Bacteroidales bacterium]MBN2755893.1 ChaN family lipoprotein [Bacteroidales bacterium]